MILHVDLDAFFASVEQLLDPTLAGKPVIVAGIGRRGVVSAASYEARAFGVHSALPTAVARRLCPNGVFVSPRHGVYEEYSRRVMAMLGAVTPLVEQLSIDEAFLNVSGARRLLGEAPEIARLIRQRVNAEIGLTVSVGVASTKFLAKIASDLAKPDGLLVVEPGRELEFLHPLAVERLWGVCPKSFAKLQRLGIATVGDLARLPIEALTHALGDAHGRHLYALAHNQDPRDVVPERTLKSVGNEETFGSDVRERAAAEREITRLADRVASRLRAGGHAARTITLKARYGDFTTLTRARTLATATATSTVIAQTARELLDGIDVARGVRLLGVSASQLRPLERAEQGLLDLGAVVDDEIHVQRRAAVEAAVDQVRARFGDAAVAPATLVQPHHHEDGP